MTYPVNYPTAINQMTPAFSIVGSIPSSNYDKFLNEIDVTPSGMSYISTISSVAGGVLVYETRGIICAFTMAAGAQYFVSWPVDNTQILSSGDTWEGNTQTNTVTDLMFGGN